MQYLFSSRNQSVLEDFTLSDTLVAFDFDGTLAPIVHNRNNAAIRRSTRDLLSKLATLYPCVVISGRARKDVLRRLEGVGINGVVGNHGIEPMGSSPGMEDAVKRWLPLLKDRLRSFPGVAIENKRFSLAIHYREEPRTQKARAIIAAAAAKLGEVRLVGGKQVVNILPIGAPHKGQSLEQELRKRHCKKAIYVGDDDTDEDVFALPNSGRFLTIRVGLNRGSVAAYYIRTQREIDRIIRSLIEIRSDASLLK